MRGVGLIFIPTGVRKRERELGACVSGSEQAGQISLRFSCSTKQANIIAQAGRLVGGQTISLGHVRISFHPITSLTNQAFSDPTTTLYVILAEGTFVWTLRFCYKTKL